MKTIKRHKPRSLRLHPKVTAFEMVSFPMIPVDRGGFRGISWGQGIAAFLALSVVVFALASPRAKPHAAEDPPFLFEETVMPPPPTPDPEPASPPPVPEPLRAEPLPEEPPPQFGLQEADLSETGGLEVSAGNTLLVAADSLAASAPPSLPPSPLIVDQPPRILSGVAPEYPLRALDRGLEGTVIVIITIDTVGKVTLVTVEKSAGGDFDKAALVSARATRFQPPMHQGRKVAAKFRRPYEFRLE